MTDEDSMIRRLSDLQASQPTDATLRNLIELLQNKLELSARLPVLVFEAEGDGDHECARLLRSLALSEREQIAALLEGLRTHLDVQFEHTLAAQRAGTTSPPA
jgi:hypothetical protein